MAKKKTIKAKKKTIKAKKKTIKRDRYVVQDREAGNVIDGFKTLKDAEKALEKYERSDKKEGIFEENFYEIAVIGKIKK